MTIQRIGSRYILSGESAEAFQKYLDYPPPNPLADAALRRGQEIAEEIAKKGYFTINPTKEDVEAEADCEGIFVDLSGVREEDLV